MARPFFDESRAFVEQHQQLNDFIWSTAAALWNLRWQVRGYVDASGADDEASLRNRFSSGSSINRTNLRGICLESSWDDQQHQFASYMLIDIIALFEGWVDSIVARSSATSKVKTAKRLQQPSHGHGVDSHQEGFSWAMKAMTANTSGDMDRGLADRYRLDKKYCLASIEATMVAYRYFKQVRNCIVHSGGRADPYLLDWETEYKKLTPAELGVSERPEFMPSKQGEPVKLSLRGVAGFTDIPLRTVRTVDALMVGTREGEEVFVKRWRTALPEHRQLPADSAKRARRIENHLLYDLRLPAATDYEAMHRVLKRNHLAF